MNVLKKSASGELRCRDRSYSGNTLPTVRELLNRKRTGELKMNLLTLEIIGADETVKASNSAPLLVSIAYEKSYEPGDTIILRSSKEKVYLVIQLDDAMNPGFCLFGRKGIPIQDSVWREENLVFP
jgi:hypothetical protein